MAGGRPRFWTRALAIEIAIVVLTPVVLGAVVGLFEINPIEAEMLAPVGSEAHLLLDPFPDNTLVVEIAYQTSAGPPDPSVVSTLLERIHETCSKATVRVDEHAFASSATSFSDRELLGLEPSVRQTWPTWGTMSIFYFYLGGTSSSTSGEIGVAFRGSSMAVFEGTIVQSAGAANPIAITTTVFVHEFGHELGLVGIVGFAPNEDPRHPYHSNDSSDVMYWAVDTAQVSTIVGGPPTEFSAADLADLATVRSTPIPYEVLPWVVLSVSIVVAAVFLWSRRRELQRLAREVPPPTSPPGPTP